MSVWVVMEGGYDAWPMSAWTTSEAAQAEAQRLNDHARTRGFRPDYGEIKLPLNRPATLSTGEYTR